MAPHFLTQQSGELRFNIQKLLVKKTALKLMSRSFCLKIKVSLRVIEQKPQDDGLIGLLGKNE